MGKLLVIGSTGQLARALRQFRPDAVFLDRAALDLGQPEQISGRLDICRPDAVINAAAYTAVDNAEKEESLAMTVNARAPEVLAHYCRERYIPFISFSSDYVFDGSGDAPWKETDAPHPLNAYGRSKLAGEKAVFSVGGKYLIFRTSWLYDAEGKNFPNTILRLASEREELRIIRDQFGALTYAPHLARAVLAALDVARTVPEFPSGIYHLCNAGVTTWYEFAAGIIAHARHYHPPLKVKHIYPIPAADYPLPATRPYNSRLDCSKALAVFNIVLPDWREGLKEYIVKKYENH